MSAPDPQPLYPVEVAEQLLTAMEPVNQLYQVMASLLTIIPNAHAPFVRLVDVPDLDNFHLYCEDVKRYAGAAYGPLRQLVDLLCKSTDQIKPSADIPQLKLSLTKNTIIQ